MGQDIPTDEETAELRDTTTSRREFGALGIGLILFIMGLAVGFPLAIIGTSFLTENAGMIVAIVLTITMLVALTGAIILLFRKKILSFLFNLSTAQLDQFSRPLSETARHIVDRQPAEAVNSAEELTRLLLARWTWIATRRWLIGSITALIAALAALAGTALLFRQNELLAIQLDRLDQQNELLTTQIELGEAQRSAGILPGLLDIGDQLAQETDRLGADGRTAAVFRLEELTDGLRARIIAASQSARPYRYLQTSPVDPNDVDGLNRLALARRPEILTDPATAAQLEQMKSDSALLKRPTSPERGVILSMLYGSGVFETELLSFYGADFAFAEVRIGTLNLMSFQFAKLRFSSFQRLALNSVQFGASELDHASFQSAVITKSNFSGLTTDEIKPPYGSEPGLDILPTNMAGTDFTQTAITGSGFRSVNGIGMIFDKALLSEVDFSGASIGGSTFLNALLVAPKFDGAFMNAVDFDGAIVFDADFLDQLEAAAAPGTFRKTRFALEPIATEDLMRHPNAHQLFLVPEALIADKTPYRVTRTEPWKQDG
jgi:uncharacterized protein YjbI with pentapeptide repeats